MNMLAKTLVGALVFLALGIGPVVADDECRSHKRSAYDQGKLFKYADQNDDGTVSQDEFISHAKTRFEKMDRNDDGVLDKSDQGMHHSFDNMDKDGDGQISREEFEQAHAGAPWGKRGSQK